MKKTTLILFNICFFSIILFFALTLNKKSTYSLLENRVLTTMPAKPLQKKADIEKYIADHIKYRKKIISLFQKSALFTSVTLKNENKNRILQGDNGYNFLINYGVFGRNLSSLASYQNKTVLTKSETSTIIKNLEYISNWCTQNHIKLYLIFPPDNMRTCHKNLPSYILKAGDKSPVKQLTEQLPSHIKVVPIEDKLTKLSDTSPISLCYKTDSHWTEFAALNASKCLIKTIKEDFNNLKELNEADYNVSWIKEIYTPYNMERNISLFNSYGSTYIASDEDTPETFYEHYESSKNLLVSCHDHRYTYKNNAGHYNALLIMDSFGSYMLSFLANSFENLYAYNFNFGNGIYFKTQQEFMLKNNIDILILSISDLKLKDLLRI